VSRKERIFSANPSRKRAMLSSRSLDVLNQLQVAGLKKKAGKRIAKEEGFYD